ncbi:hypothetical protein [Nocardioides taihuensis]|uniref:Uncharacterized protein n=1 Tax=Nocardioides taihuensis TaxID=1835606 RepID=A0ABW0BGW9_9ACTN
MNGGDVIAPARPVPLRAFRALGSAWTTIDVDALAQVPSTGLGAVLLEAASSRAGGRGTVLVRPEGSDGDGVALLRHTQSGGRGLALVKVGLGGRVEVRSTAGGPRTAVRMVAWVPETSLLTVPESTPPEQSLSLTSVAQEVALDVPPAATAVVVQLTTTSSRAGRLATWTTGLAAPANGEAFGRGTSSFLQVVRPDADDTISLRALSGEATVGVRVLGWATGESVVTSRGTTTTLLNAAPGGVRRLRLSDVAGVPAGTQDTWVSVAAPRGATVRLWGNSKGTGAPLHSWQSTGSAVSLLLPVPRSGTAAIQVSGTRGRTRVLANGFDTVAGNQKVTLRPRTGTSLLGASDVASYDGTTLALTATADPLTGGGHVLLRDDTGMPRVLSVTEVSGTPGAQTALVEDATLRDAFADARISYRGHLGPSDGSRPGSAARGGGAVALSLALGNWSCSVGGSTPAFSASYSGNANLDVNLSAGTVDFSLKGSLTTGVDLAADQAVSCTYENTGLLQVPLGATPLVVKLGPTATLSVTPFGSDTSRLALSATERIYASLYHDGNDPVVGKALSATGSSSSELNRGSAQFDIGVKVAVGPASVGELELGPEASATVGASYQLGTPDPSDDPFHRSLAGPHCTDLTNTLFLSFGASLLIPLLPDVSLDIARFDTPKVFLHKGPCVGYAGTITYHHVGSNVQGAVSCAETDEPCSDWNHTVVKTLVPQPASFEGQGYVRQPYSWTWSGQEHAYQKNYDGAWQALCTESTSYSGSGLRSWPEEDELPEGWPAPSFLSGTGPGVQTQGQMAVSLGRGTFNRTTVVQQEGGENFCSPSGSGSSWLPGVELVTEEVGGFLISMPTVALTLTGQPGDASYAEVNLTRQEFARD